MRNRIPKVKKIKIIKEEDEDRSSATDGGAINDYDKIILIKSEHPTFSHEVYRHIDGFFIGYTGNKKSTEGLQPLDSRAVEDNK